MTEQSPTEQWLALEPLITAHIASCDYPQAIAILEPLACAELPQAQYLLGWLCSAGYGHVDPDYVRARLWWERAGKNGSGNACFALGTMLEHGRGSEPDFEGACEWYRRGAELGYALAQNNLGSMLALGRGTAQDLPRAYAWFSLAMRGGYPDAQQNLARVEQSMTMPQLMEAQTLISQFISGNFN